MELPSNSQDLHFLQREGYAPMTPDTSGKNMTSDFLRRCEIALKGRHHSRYLNAVSCFYLEEITGANWYQLQHHYAMLPLSYENFLNGILHIDNWAKLLSFIECALNFEDCPPTFVADIERIFVKSPISWVLDKTGDNKKYRIIKRFPSHESVITHPRKILQKHGFSTALDKLDEAINAMGHGDTETAVNKSILAVEGVAREVSKSDKTLGAILAHWKQSCVVDAGILLSCEGLWNYSNRRTRHATESFKKPSEEEAWTAIGLSSVFCGHFATLGKSAKIAGKKKQNKKTH